MTSQMLKIKADKKKNNYKRKQKGGRTGWKDKQILEQMPNSKPLP